MSGKPSKRKGCAEERWVRRRAGGESGDTPGFATVVGRSPGRRECGDGDVTFYAADLQLQERIVAAQMVPGGFGMEGGAEDFEGGWRRFWEEAGDLNVFTSRPSCNPNFRSFGARTKLARAAPRHGKFSKEINRG